MKHTLFPIVFLLLACVSALSQKSNNEINEQIKQLNIEKSITVSYDGNTSKVMAIADNFADGESSRAGIQAMNFAVGFFYPGDRLKEEPDPIMLTFWILTKKPRFAEVKSVVFAIDDESLTIDDIRYAAKARENVEYINCKISRADLSKITSGHNVRVRIGTGEFKFLPEQLRMMSDVLIISKTGEVY